MHDEARILRTQILITMSVSKLLPLLGRLLEICSSIMNLIRGAMDIEVRFRAIECFEFVWNVSKIAIVRWEDLQGPADRNTSFNAVQYAYTMLPVFLDLEKDEHLEMTEHIILLIIDIVKDCQLPSLIRELLLRIRNFLLHTVMSVIMWWFCSHKVTLNTLKHVLTCVLILFKFVCRI